MKLDCILRGARLPGLDSPCDIALAGDRITAISPRLAETCEFELDLRGRLVLPGFANAYLWLRATPVSEQSSHQTIPLLETALRHGTTAVHLSVAGDGHEALESLHQLTRVRTRLAGRATIAIALRLNRAWRTSSHTLAMQLDAIKRAGADAIEITVDAADKHQSLRDIASLAASADLALDIELDAVLPPDAVALDTLALPRVLDALESLDARPRMRLIHATALAAVHRDELTATYARLHRLGIVLVLCPYETLRTAGRADQAGTRRGLPRLRELMAAGVRIALGSGAAAAAAALDPLAMLWLAAYAGHTGTPAALERARSLITPGSVTPGAAADLVVLEAPTFAQAVVDHAEKAFVLKNGKIVHRTSRIATIAQPHGPKRLVIREATLLRRTGPLDVLVEGGLIREIARKIDATDAEEIAAGGRLLIPAFVDAHLHVDKTFVMDGLALGPHILTVAEAIAAMHRAKSAYTPDDLLARGRLTLTRALRHGVTAIRAQCDVDPIIGLMALEALVTLRREFAGRLDLQIVAFPQEGLVDNPQAIALMRQALQSGADVVGGGPLDRDYRAHIAQVFALAREFDAPVDLHADLAIDRLRPLSEWEAPLIAAHAKQSGLVGRVAIGHFAASSTLDPHQLQVVAAQLAEAGISVAALPASEMYRQGMADPVNSRRGVPRVRELLAAGVNVAFASNNLRDAFVTFGNADMLEQALLAATAVQLDDMDTVLGMVTGRAARLMGLDARDGVAKGRQADLVLLDARSPAEAVGNQAEKLFVIRRGQIVARHRVEIDAQPDMRNDDRAAIVDRSRAGNRSPTLA